MELMYPAYSTPDNPAFPLLIPIVILVELLFGLGFNVLVDWAHQHKIWHVSVSVSLGVAGTLIIATLGFWRFALPFWAAMLILTACFVASGLPMVIGSTRRAIKTSHQRRPLPNAAMRIRDDLVMDVNAKIEQIIAKQMDIAELVHVMHKWIGALKSM
jgi:hypothetical protein